MDSQDGQNGDSQGGGTPEPPPAETPAPAPGQARWVRERRGREIDINWAFHLSGIKPVDPYLVWADVSHFAGFAAGAKVGTLPFMIELSPREQAYEVPPGENVSPVFGLISSFPSLYERPLAGENDQRMLRTRFITADVVLYNLGALMCLPEVERMQLGVPRVPDGRPTAPKLRQTPSAGEKARTVIGIIDDGCAFAHPAFCDGDGTTRVHFLWDQNRIRQDSLEGGWHVVKQARYGAELRHAALGLASRKAATAGSDEVAYHAVNYGPVRQTLEYTGTMFRCGRDLDLPVAMMEHSAHGTSVMFLATGVARSEPAHAPLRQQRATLADPAGLARCTDYATRWPIVFVQLPTLTTLDTSGGSLGLHVLDGLHYIMDRASCLPGRSEDFDDGASDDDGEEDENGEPLRFDGGNRVIINISYGAVAGPHDGTSMLEQALADLVRPRTYQGDWGMYPRLWICVAAGNAHRSRNHARLVLRPGECKSLAWRVPPDNPLQSFLEIWLPESDGEGRRVPAQSLDAMWVRVTPPGGVPAQTVRCGQLWVCQLDAARTAQAVAAVVYARRVVQGLRGTMVLVAVAATRPLVDEPAGPVAPHGQWLVELQRAAAVVGDDASEWVVNAWTERNDLVFGTPRAQQATVEAEDPIPEPTEYTPDARQYMAARQGPWPTRHLQDQLQARPTLGSLAGAAPDRPSPTPFFESYARNSSLETGQVVAVGAYRLADEQVADYASGGPQRHVIEGAVGQSAPIPAETLPLYQRTASKPRMEPDVQAPGDIGSALRGLRTVGMRAGSVERLSGTSAATPSAARLIANMQYAYTWSAGPASEYAVPTPSAGAFGAAKLPPAVLGWPEPWRPTPTPVKDDLFRRGPWRVR